MTEMQQWVEFYKAHELTYFPLFGILNGQCRCPEGAACTNMGKHPKFKWKGKPARTPGPSDNIGVSTDNLVVIDIDGDVSESVLSEYPRTFTTSTGHGYHLWYLADPTKNVKSIAGWKHKVDIRAIGGLVVAPPSRHRSGSQYRHVAGDSIQRVPRDLLDSLPERPPQNRKIGYTVTDIIPETHPMMNPLAEMLVNEVLNCTGARNQTLFRVACRYFELAATKTLGIDVLRELFEAALKTGLGADEIERTLESARRSV